jgi:hypothetical protein
VSTEIVASIATAAAAILAGLDLRERRRNKRIRTKYRQALKDLRGFYEIEARLCAAFLKARWDNPSPPSPDKIESSELAIKRLFRCLVRADGMETPSGMATPQRIAEELAKL